MNIKKVGLFVLLFVLILIVYDAQTSQKKAQAWYDEMTNHDSVGWSYIEDADNKTSPKVSPKANTNSEAKKLLNDFSSHFGKAEYENAGSVYKKLMEMYPNSPEAKEAEEYMQMIADGYVEHILNGYAERGEYEKIKEIMEKVQEEHEKQENTLIAVAVEKYKEKLAKHLDELKEAGEIFATAEETCIFRYDDMEEILWTFDKETTQFTSFKNNFSLYLGKRDSEDITFAQLAIFYTSNEWLFIEKYIIKTDNNSYTVNGNQECSDFGNQECSVFGNNSAVKTATMLQ